MCTWDRQQAINVDSHSRYDIKMLSVRHMSAMVIRISSLRSDNGETDHGFTLENEPASS